MKTLTDLFTGYKGAVNLVEGFLSFLRDEELDYSDMALAITGEHPEGLVELTEAIIDAVNRERIIDKDHGSPETYQEAHELTVLNWLLAHQQELVVSLEKKPLRTVVSDKVSTLSGTSLYERDRAYVNTYSRTKDHRASVRAYCGDNKWAIENAKGTGNW